MDDPDFIEALRTLDQFRVEFILVGGLSAVVNGVPVHTYDVDVVYARTSENIDRLLPFLESLDAIFRLQPERRLAPNRSHLVSAGHQNLITRYGPLDLLGTIGKNLGYAELLPHSTEMLISEGIRIRVLNLETLIALKEELGGAKDQAMLPLLRQTLKLQREQK